MYNSCTVKIFTILFISSKKPDHNYVGKTKLCINELCDTKYPVQMLEVAGDLRWVPADFENPACYSQSHMLQALLRSSGEAAKAITP